jgi:hypothetical protein
MDFTDSCDIATAWYEGLLSSVEVNDFCEAEFGCKPSLFLDFDPRDPEGSRDAPFIGVIPISDRDGEEIEIGAHVVMVVLGINDKAKTSDDDGRGVRYLGGQTLKRMEAIVRGYLSALEYPLSDWQAEKSNPGRGYFERHIFITVNIPNTLGL